MQKQQNQTCTVYDGEKSAKKLSSIIHRAQRSSFTSAQIHGKKILMGIEEEVLIESVSKSKFSVTMPFLQ
jgi:hypothetical protein